MVACNSCEKIGAFVEFSGSIAPVTGGKTKGKEMMCLLQGLLKVGASIFAGMRHKVDNRSVVAFNNDAVGPEGGVMFSCQLYCGCGSCGFSVSRVWTWVEW